MCSCEDIDGSCEFEHTTYPRSRVERECEECSGRIRPGDKYARTVSKWEGEIMTSVVCADCNRWARAFVDAQRRACGCAGWLLGELWRAINEFRDEHMDPSGVIPMAPPARRGLGTVVMQGGA
ncbi:MAG TPA: hypothetical protein VK841_09510 [Polyangiaceae bacterium]|jgi:hypothetical protein|nr:hypothetical protein [Polyangiaceae bacterium]